MAAVLPITRLEPQVRELAGEPQRGRWVVAVSGGADSVALLLLIWAHWPERRRKLVVAHFNHRMRGRASVGDGRFCAALAKGLEVPFETEKWADRPSRVSESQAREARNAFLGRVRRKYRSMVIWTGHQQDDIAESMLMRLSRGAGSAGLAAPRPVQDWEAQGLRCRPMLRVSRSEIRAALTECGGIWREDESNEGNLYFRNRVRQEVLPRLVEAAGRDAVAGAALSRHRLDEDDRALEGWLREIDPFDVDGRLNLKALEGKPTAIWRRALNQWLGNNQANRGDLSRRGFEQLLGIIREGKTSRFSLGTTGFARIRRGRLYFEKLSS